MPKELTKKCSRCGDIKPLTEFYHNRTKKDFHSNICSKCQLEVNEINKK
jgi:hypothetical protein